MVYLGLVSVWFILGCVAGLSGLLFESYASLLLPLLLGLVVYDPNAAVSRKLLGLLAALCGLCAALVWRGVTYDDMQAPIAMLLFGFIASLAVEAVYKGKTGR